jgi:hypothetical protein
LAHFSFSSLFELFIISSISPFFIHKPNRPAIIEVANSLDVRHDIPLDWQKRLFGSRCVETKYLEEVADVSV